MIVELHDHLTQPNRLTATRVLIRDQYGQPIAIFLQVSDKDVIVETAKNKVSFERMLKQWGVSQTAIITVADRPHEIIIGEDD